jgi:hypothetical protein
MRDVPVKAPANQYDEQLIDFFDDEIVGHADQVYRFAFTLTLALDQAQRLTKKTYETAVSELGKLSRLEGTAAVAWLLGECWKLSGGKGAKAEGGATPVMRAMKGQTVEQRAVLCAVDVCGLSPAEATRVFGWSEPDLRRKLAEARKSLVANGVQ